ncbi:hypothetical protein ACIQUS_23185 [Pseudomonas sp. NPDC090755]|uniref:hypothetical protein n=1 Tax=Pseudomonas sp. NPDC090755 TaxID=3364481 RepID=UPI00383A9C0E
MATLVFDSDEDSQAQAIVLVEALNIWLKEQQPTNCPITGAKADFRYRPDGTLDSVSTALTGEAGEE